MNRDDTTRAARAKAFTLYEGTRTPHRSCGIALAETFGRRTTPYQSLRRGGITGCGECGAVIGGRLVLGELLGDPDPTGGVTQELRAAMVDFEAKVRGRLDRGDAPGDSLVCNTLTGQFPEFRSAERAAFCTAIATEVAGTVAEVALDHGAELTIAPIPLTHRPYTAADRDAAIAVCRSTVPTYVRPHEVADFEGFLDKLEGYDCRYVVVEDADAEIVAVGGVAIEDDHATLCWGLVHAERHGTGLGRWLLEVRLGWLRKDADVERVELCTTQHTQGFFAHFGFEVVAVDKDHFAPGLDRYDMVLDVSRGA